MPYRIELTAEQRQLIESSLNSSKWLTVSMANTAKREHDMVRAHELHSRAKEFADLASLVACLPELPR